MSLCYRITGKNSMKIQKVNSPGGSIKKTENNSWPYRDSMLSLQMVGLFNFPHLKKNMPKSVTKVA